MLTYTVDQLHSLNTPGEEKIAPHILTRLRDFNICRTEYKRTKRGSRGGKKVNTTHVCDSKTKTVEKTLYGITAKSNTPACENLAIHYTNARSVRNKTDTLYEHIVSYDLDVFIITETWLKDTTKKDKVTIKNLLPDGYSYKSCNREGKKGGGGIIIIYKTALPVLKRNGNSFSTFEHLILDMKLNGQQLKLTCVYRPPHKKHGLFLSEFQDFVSENNLDSEKNLIVGDFNFHLDNETDSTVTKFNDILESHNLKQHVDEPTHEKGHILDLVITSTSDHFVSSVDIEHDSYSDHSIILLSLCHKKPQRLTKTITTRKLRHVNTETLCTAIEDSNIKSKVENAKTVCEKLDIFNSTLIGIIDTLAPARTKTITIRPKTHWFCEDIKNAKREKRKAERKWRRTKLEVDRQIYVKLKQDTNNLITRCKEKYVKDNIVENKHDTKALYRILNGLVNPEASEKALPQNDSAGALAEQFSDFFINKILNIRKELDIVNSTRASKTSVDETHSDETTDAILTHFSEATREEVRDIIIDSPDKTCSLDKVPTWMVKKCVDVLAPAITSIVNASLKEASVPPELKHALVTPLLKKPSLDPDNLSNYRPVSNLNFVGKLIEKVVAKRMRHHLSQHDLVPEFQSAYRPRHSTETALLRVHNDIVLHIDKGNCVLLVLLDLSAAFDTIDHGLLLHRLYQSFGIRQDALKWIESYMKHRTQAIRLDLGPSISSMTTSEATSKPARLTCGVPQGSILGPLLFTLYTAPLSDLIRSHGIDHHLYADDTQLYVAVNKDNLSTTISKLEACCLFIKHWMTTNLLKLNDTKTEVLVLGTNQKRKQLNVNSINVGSAKISIQKPNAVRNLGVYFDPDISMKTNVTKICQSAHFHLRNIGKARRMLDTNSAKVLVQSLVTSRLDYCNSVLLGTPDVTVTRLQKLQNRAARLVTLTKPEEHITPILESLHWLPIKERIVFKVATLMYQCINESAPKYLSDLVEVYAPPRTLRSSSKLKVSVPASRLLLAERAFSVSGAKIWNDIDLSVKQAPSLTSFKKRLKTYLFRKSYSQK